MDATADNRLSIRLAFKPWRDMFVFSGRSTRTEVAAFYLLSSFGNIYTIDGPGGPVLDAARVLWAVLWCIPLTALLVRRLHDQGWSGWFALTLLAFAIPVGAIMTLPQASHWSSTWRFSIWVSHPTVTPLSTALSAIAVGAILALFMLFLRTGTIGPNRYGPDPRV